MARITRAEMEIRENAMSDLLEDATDGLTVTELIAGLKEKGVALPPSEYQAVFIVLKTGEKKGMVVKRGKKWFDCAVAEKATAEKDIIPEEKISSEVKVDAEEAVSDTVHADV
jgi:hypothetical protein